MPNRSNHQIYRYQNLIIHYLLLVHVSEHERKRTLNVNERFKKWTFRFLAVAAVLSAVTAVVSDSRILPLQIISPSIQLIIHFIIAILLIAVAAIRVIPKLSHLPFAPVELRYGELSGQLQKLRTDLTAWRSALLHHSEYQAVIHKRGHDGDGNCQACQRHSDVAQRGLGRLKEKLTDVNKEMKARLEDDARNELDSLTHEFNALKEAIGEVLFNVYRPELLLNNCSHSMQSVVDEAIALRDEINQNFDLDH